MALLKRNFQEKWENKEESLHSGFDNSFPNDQFYDDYAFSNHTGFMESSFMSADNSVQRQNDKLLLDLDLERLERDSKNKRLTKREIKLMQLYGDVKQGKLAKESVPDVNIELVTISNTKETDGSFKDQPSTIINLKRVESTMNFDSGFLSFSTMPHSHSFKDTEDKVIIQDVALLENVLRRNPLYKGKLCIAFKWNVMSIGTAFSIQSGFKISSDQIHSFQAGVSRAIFEAGLEKAYQLSEITAVNYELNPKIQPSFSNDNLAQPQQQKTPVIDKAAILHYRTQRFFQKNEGSNNSKWVEKKLDSGRYRGHDMHFLTMPEKKRVMAGKLSDYLQKFGFQKVTVEDTKPSKYPCVTVTLDECQPEVPKNFIK